MISFSLAVRAMGWVLLLPVLFFVFLVASRVQVRFAGSRREASKYRIGSYLCLLMFLASLLSWINLVCATRFNWSRADAKEIEVVVYPSPDPDARTERTISITDDHVVSRLFDAFETLQPHDTGGHGHHVGRSYILRLRRRSDDEWSTYTVKIYPDWEPTGGGLHVNGIHELSIRVGSWGLSGLQAPNLGNLVEELVKERPTGLP